MDYVNKQFSFSTWIMLLEIQLQESLLIFNEVRKLGIVMNNCKLIYFLSDIFPCCHHACTLRFLLSCSGNEVHSCTAGITIV